MQKILQIPIEVITSRITAFAFLITMLTLFTYTAKGQVYDLSLISGISTDYDTAYCPGDEVRFNNVIYNMGEVEACNVEITAYIPAGTSVSSNPLNSVWTINGSSATTTITMCIPPGGIYPNAESGSLSTFLELELNNPAGSVINFYAEISQDDGDDIDSTPDSDPNNDAGAIPNSGTDGVIWGEFGDEDDHDVSSITVLECQRTGCTDPCAPNYDSTANVEDGSCISYSTECNSDICAGDVTVWNSNTCGCQVTTTQIVGCDDPSANNYNPAANCNNPNTCTYTPVGDYDLALITGISSTYGTTYCPGDEVRFNTVLYNTGDIEACNVEITAYIPEGMSVSSNPLNSIWTINGSVATANITSCIPPGGVYPNAGSDILSSFLVLEITSSTAATVEFYAEISQDDGDDIDSTPDNDPNNDAGAIPNTSTDNSIYNTNDEDDHDVASIIICDPVIYDLALITEVAAGYDTTVNPGDEVGFSTTVYNQGDDIACNVEVVAYIPAGMSLSSNPLNSIWTVNGSTATTTINTCIDPGDAELVNIYLTLNEGATGSSINFYAEISQDDGEDIDSTSDNNISNDQGAIPGTVTDNAINGEMGDEDDHDVAVITAGNPGIYDLALITGISSTYGTVYCPGDEVRFNTVIYNTGDIEACNVEITAYIPEGMSVSDNPLNSIWTINGSTATATINSCIPAGGTYPNASTDPLSAFLILEITGAPGTVINFYSEISQDDGDDIDSTPDNNPNNDPGAIPGTSTDNAIYNQDGDEDDHDVASITIGNCNQGIYDLALITGISSSYGNVYCPGDEVRFNTVIYNLGEVEACDVEITAYIPDGMSVSNNPLNSIWTINGSTATANINSCIPPGGTYPNASTDPLSAFLILEITGDPGTMINFYSEISQDDGDDIDSTPDNDPNNDAGAVPNTSTDNSIYSPQNIDEDDHDVASIIICDQAIYDLALTTMLAAGYDSTVNIGDEVGFTTTVYNQGEEQACNVEVTAYIPIGMSLSDNPLNSIWTVNGVHATTTINTCIEPGGSESVNIYLTLDQAIEGSSINFYAEISSDDGNDIDSTADNSNNNDTGAVPNSGTDNTINGEMGDEDDHDVAAITVGDPAIYDLALITGISSTLGTIYCPGDEIRYNTAIYNTGEIEACNVEITAYIPEGMIVSDNPLNSIWTINGSIATANISSCIPPGGVYPNPDSDILSAFLILELDNVAGSVVNFYTEISADDGDDQDSNADNDPNNDAGAIPGTVSDNAIYNQGGDEDDHDVASISVNDDCGGFSKLASGAIGQLSIEYLHASNKNVNVVLASDNVAPTTIQIVDLNGLVVYKENLQLTEKVSQVRLNVNFLSNGVYLLRVVKGDQMEMGKFLIE